MYRLIDLAKESMEMMGASLFLCSLAELLASRSGELRLAVEREELMATSPDAEPAAR